MPQWTQLPLLPDAQASPAARGELAKCALSFPYWLDTYAQVYDPAARGWVRFRLWPAQLDVAERLPEGRRFVILKARQLGLTWLATGFALWLMLFRPAATALLFSVRDDEAVHLLKFRLRGMLDRLPEWMQGPKPVVDNDHEARLANGSAALAFPTTGGRSYTATFALVDEADHTPDLDRLLDAVKPTVDGGGWLLLLSTADKTRPGSAFKRIYEGARGGRNDYTPLFLPWTAHPARDAGWYAAIARDFLARDGTSDSLCGEYPATDVEALAGRASDRRFPAAWLAACDGTGDPGEQRSRGAEGQGGRGAEDSLAPLPLRSPAPLQLFVPPAEGRAYVIGADPAEGNPQSDESAATVLDAETGEQSAVLAGRIEPAVFAAALATLAAHYSDAPILVERNNHGHGVLLALREGTPRHAPRSQPASAGFAASDADFNRRSEARLLDGTDGRAGWLTTARNKALACDVTADALRETRTRIRDRETLRQLMALRGASLSAGPAEADDRALAFILAHAALRCANPTGGAAESALIPPEPVVDMRETSGW
jgi:hypothetical protein